MATIRETACGLAVGEAMAEKPTSFKPVSGNVMPRFSGISTFMRLPHVSDTTGVDIGLIGVPWDGGTTNRAGARHGPRQIRDLSTMVRNVHHQSRIKPFELCNCADLGDVPVNPIDLHDTLARVEAYYRRVHEAGVVPLSAGGDHLITLPIMRAIAKDRPVGMVHFDAHTDTWDRYFGDSIYTHGTPFRRAVEEGLLDPKRTVQIGIRGALYSEGDNDWGEQQGIRVITIDEFYAWSATGRPTSASTSTGWTRSMRRAPARRRSAASPPSRPKPCCADSRGWTWSAATWWRSLRPSIRAATRRWSARP